MKVLIADKFQQSGIDALGAIGCTVISLPDISPDEVAAAVMEHDPDVLVVRSTKVFADVFAKANKLALVVRAGAGYDNIDTDAASAAGISVANCPGKNAIAVAELAWGLILAADRCIADQTADLRAGRWNKKGYAKKGLGLYGRTLGVIGTGNIGREVIRRAHAFGMPVVAWSRSLDDATAKQLGVTRVDSPIEVARRADVVSLHVAATADTNNLVDAAFLDAMRPGSTLVNTARGGVVDQAALLRAMREKGIRAALDVYQGQPSPTDSVSDIDLAKADPGEVGFVGTHHCGASTEQAQEAIAEETVRIIKVYRDTGDIPNVVNRASKSAATRLLVVRHLNRPGVLAHVIGRIGEAKLNIEEMENVIYESAKAACAKIQLDAEPDEATMEKIRTGNEHVLSVDLTIIEQA